MCSTVSVEARARKGQAREGRIFAEHRGPSSNKLSRRARTLWTGIDHRRSRCAAGQSVPVREAISPGCRRSYRQAPCCSVIGLGGDRRRRRRRHHRQRSIGPYVCVREELVVVVPVGSDDDGDLVRVVSREVVVDGPASLAVSL